MQNDELLVSTKIERDCAPLRARTHSNEHNVCPLAVVCTEPCVSSHHFNAQCTFVLSADALQARFHQFHDVSRVDIYRG